MAYPLYRYTSAPWVPSEFHAIDDRVRGGSSQSYLSFPKEDEEQSGRSTRFHGHLDIKTLGGAGFASQCTNSAPDPLPASRYSGIQFTCLPSPLNSLSSNAPSDYVLVLKDIPAETRPDGRIESRVSYEYHFTYPADSTIPLTLVANWQDFQPTYRGRPQTDKHTKLLNPGELTELSWMCRSGFGKQEGDFELRLGQVCALMTRKPSAWEWAKSWLKWIFRTRGWFWL